MKCIGNSQRIEEALDKGQGQGNEGQNPVIARDNYFTVFIYTLLVSRRLNHSTVVILRVKRVEPWNIPHKGFSTTGEGRKEARDVQWQQKGGLDCSVGNTGFLSER